MSDQIFSYCAFSPRTQIINDSVTESAFDVVINFKNKLTVLDKRGSQFPGSAKPRKRTKLIYQLVMN